MLIVLFVSSVYFYRHGFLTKNYVNRRRACPCPVVEVSVGRCRSVRSTRRGRSRPRIQECKDALLRRSDPYRSSKLGTARHESCAVQVLWDMRRMPVPGTGPSKDPGRSRIALTVHA